MAQLRFTISPNFGEDKLKSGKIEDRIDILEDRIRGWLIAPARALLSVKHGEFASFGISLTYFEGHHTFRSGKDSHNHSCEFFTKGFQAVFFNSGEYFPEKHAVVKEAEPEESITKVGKKLYSLARCGLFHSGLAREGIFLGPGAMPIASSYDLKTREVEAIFIDPALFLANIDAQFGTYLADLRNPKHTELRSNFESAWMIVNPGREIHIPPGKP